MNKKGFTLIELLVVVAIIGLLSTIAVVALGSARETARDAKRLSDLKQLHDDLEIYYSTNNAYPISATPVLLGNGNYGCLNVSGFGPAGCTAPYVASVPTDPNGNAYTYQTNANGSSYTITATLEGTVNNMTGAIQAAPTGVIDVAG